MKLPEKYKGATPGPWGWFGSTYSNGRGFYLATTHSGRRYVMEFARFGMRNAQPVFQINKRMVKAQDIPIYEVNPGATNKDDPSVYREDIIGFRSADAQLIADAPMLACRVAELEKALQAVIEHHTALNTRKGRPVENSRTIAICRQALAGHQSQEARAANEEQAR